MAHSPLKRLFSTVPLTTLFGLLFLGTAGAMLLLPGPRSPLPGLGLAAMALVGMLAIRGLVLHAREIELALEEGERYIEVVADLSQDIHAIIGARERHFLYLNPAVADLLGYPQQAFLDGGLVFFSSLVHPEDLPALQVLYEKLLAPLEQPLGPGQREETHEQTFRIRDHRGIYRWFKSRMSVFLRTQSGQPSELLAVIHDVTEERSYEAALLQAQKHESLAVLARGTLHDLNNTLMGIQGFTEIALEGPGDPAVVRRYLENIQTSVNRASVLCKQMVAYTGSSRPQIAPHRLNDAVRESLPAIESMVPQGGHLELDLEEDLPPVPMDLNQVRYALLNLVYNAADAIRIPGGEICIRTRVKQMTQAAAPGLEGPHVCLEVRDSGPGRPQEIMDRIYDPLFTAKWPGNGLGLSAVAGIMREHRGAVLAVSVLGQGDTAQLFFPMAGKAPDLDPGEEATPAGSVSGVILLVDDEPTVRAILRQGLEIAGFRVLEASDGVEGVSAFIRHRPTISLVMLDLTMPRMGGEEAFEEIPQVGAGGSGGAHERLQRDRGHLGPGQQGPGGIPGQALQPQGRPGGGAQGPGGSPGLRIEFQPTGSLRGLVPGGAHANPPFPACRRRPGRARGLRRARGPLRLRRQGRLRRLPDLRLAGRAQAGRGQGRGVRQRHHGPTRAAGRDRGPGGQGLPPGDRSRAGLPGHLLPGPPGRALPPGAPGRGHGPGAPGPGGGRPRGRPARGRPGLPGAGGPGCADPDPGVEGHRGEGAGGLGQPAGGGCRRGRGGQGHAQEVPAQALKGAAGANEPTPLFLPALSRHGRRRRHCRHRLPCPSQTRHHLPVLRSLFRDPSRRGLHPALALPRIFLVGRLHLRAWRVSRPSRPLREAAFRPRDGTQPLLVHMRGNRPKGSKQARR